MLRGSPIPCGVTLYPAGNPITYAAACCAGKEGGVRPDCSHVYLAVLPLLPLHLPKEEAKIAGALR